MSDSFDWYKKIYNTKETKEVDNLNKAIRSIKGFLKKREEGDYEIEEKEGVVQTHEKSGVSEGMAGMEGTLEEIIEELLAKDLTPEARAKLEKMKALMVDYKHAEDVFETQREINDAKKKISGQLEDMAAEINEYMNEHTLYNIEIKQEGETGLTLDDIFPDAGKAPKKKRKKKNEFDFELPTDDGGGEWDAAPAKAKKKKATVKAKQKVRAAKVTTKAKAKVKPKKVGVKAKAAPKVKVKDVEAPKPMKIPKTKSVKVKTVKLPQTKSTKPIAKMSDSEKAQLGEQTLKEFRELEKEAEELFKKMREKNKILKKLGILV